MLRPLMIDGRPHWEVRFDEEWWPLFEDFRNFLCYTWNHLGLPEPTRAQLEVGHRLQYGVDSVEWEVLTEPERAALYTQPREDILRAFRFLGKSYITSAFVTWRLMRNPRDEKALVISATSAKSKEFVTMTKRLMLSMEVCRWLLDGPIEDGSVRRDEADRFDVAGASNSQSQSVKAVGIDGQITGGRATLIIPDDIEIVKNSKTEEARTTILNAIRSDLPWVARTEHGKGDIIFLGTPQTEESVYNVLVKEMGYRCFCIPARFPDADKLKNYELERQVDKARVNILAYYLRAMHNAGEIDHGSPTDTRFTREELIEEEAKGRSHFALQMMLDTSLSDAERFPLKQHDLIVMPLNAKKAPITVQWGHEGDRKNRIDDIPNLGFSGDHFLRPLFIDREWRDYEGKVLWVDPAGRGTDETAWCVMAQLSGMLFILEVGGEPGDARDGMIAVATAAKRWDVNVIEVEPNFAGDIWIHAFSPILLDIWNAKHDVRDKDTNDVSAKVKAEQRMSGCTVQPSEWAKGQKETRIIGTLEPALNTHRIVISETVVREDVEATVGAESAAYSLMYQLTHLTKERGSLKHDDRIEVIAGAVSHYERTLGMDVKQSAAAIIEAEMEAEIEDFIEMHEGGWQVGRRRGKRRADGQRSEVTIVNW